MKRIERTDATTDLPLRPRPPGCAVPLTAAQLRRFEVLQKLGLLSTRMCATAVQIIGELKVDLLISSLNTLIHRHEALRTRIVRLGGELQQLVEPAGECALETIDLSRSTSDAHKEALRLAQAFIDQQIDVLREPLFAAQLIKLSEREHALIIMLDHMVCDAASCLILNKELWTLYEAAEKGHSASLPQLPVQYPDYAVWQQGTYDSWLKRHGPYWKQRLAGAPHLTIPTDLAMTGAARPYGAVMHVLLGHALSTQLRDFAKRQHTLLPIVMLTLYVIVMAHWCSQNDLIIEFLTHGRLRPELQNLIGYFATPLNIRVILAKANTPLDLLRDLDKTLGAAYNHYDSGQLYKALPLQSTELMFNWVPGNWAVSTNDQLSHHHQLELQPAPIVPRYPSKFMPLFFKNGEDIGVSIHYLDNALKYDSVQRFVHNLRLVAQECLQAPTSSIASILSSLNH